jgi:hypothetical protein
LTFWQERVLGIGFILLLSKYWDEMRMRMNDNENENPAVNIESFAMILYEIVVRHLIKESHSEGFSGLDILRRKRPLIAVAINSNWRVLIERC